VFYLLFLNIFSGFGEGGVNVEETIQWFTDLIFPFLPAICLIVLVGIVIQDIQIYKSGEAKKIHWGSLIGSFLLFLGSLILRVVLK
jgi:hypothetical protein